MPLSTIDPIPALIVVDLQRGVLALPTVHPIPDVVGRAAELAAAFRQHEHPVVLVTVSGGAPGRTDQASGASATVIPLEYQELAAELDAQPSDIRIDKRTWGAFHGTGLHDALQRRGVTQVVVCGVSTSAGVQSTARAAHEHGYHVVIATDAITDRSAEAHAASVDGIFPRISETATTAEIVAMVQRARA